ncbi:MAG: nuclear transport factor 2 family protein [Caulobacteraceae bacterium]|nr:nuclear transport factor 2 family protein [Caulobacteraceae bacterium]
MKTALMAIMAVTLAAPATFAATPDELMAAPRAFIAALDRDDMAAAGKTLTASPSFIDEFPPHAWSGPDALKQWGADYAAANKAAHMTGGKVKLGDPIVAQAEGDTAYVVAAANETYKQDGKRTAESARMVFALRREGGTWKIASWAWAGRQPHVEGAGATKAP